MSDWLNDSFASTGRPRVLGREFRERLERAIRRAAAKDGADEDLDLTGIDRPRQMPESLRSRVETRLARGKGPRRGVLSGLAAACVLVLVAGTFVLNSDRDGASGDGSLRAFTSRAEFLTYVKRESLKIAGPYGLLPTGASAFHGGAELSTGLGVRDSVALGADTAQRGPAAAPLPSADGGSFSKTNVQEEGVDEPDLVKTDGKRLFVTNQEKVWILDVSDRSGRVLGSVDIPNGIGIFVSGDRLIHFASAFEQIGIGSQSGNAAVADSIGISPIGGGRPSTKVTVVDISDPSKPGVVSSMKVEGAYVGARQVGGTIRLIVQSGALGPEPVPLPGVTEPGAAVGGSPPDTGVASVPETLPQSPEDLERAMKLAEAANKKAIRDSRVEDWVPQYRVEKPGQPPVDGPVHDWDAISRPPEPAGISMLTVMTIDPLDPRPDNAISMVGAGDMIYSSATGLYVTSSRFDDVIRIQQGRAPQEPLTRIHKFDISDPGKARYAASGSIEGYLLNQFSMSEHEGHLRVASTRSFPGIEERGGNGSESAVTTFKEEGGKLVQVGSVGGLGKGERIYSVRFIGPMGYVVTFRQVDPLYVVDLRDPAKPEVKGELKIPGYSAYLHPISDTLIIGVGRFADQQGRAGGLQFSLFDVSDPADPRRLHERVVGRNAYSEVEHNHLGFLYWAPKGLIVIPASIFDEGAPEKLPFVGALALGVDQKNGFGEPAQLTHMGRVDIQHGLDAIRRSVVVGEDLITISDGGVLLSDLDTLQDRTFVSLITSGTRARP